jgi:CheY-like chemotaxis protein
LLDTQLAAWRLAPEIASDGPAALIACYRAADAGRPYQLAVIDQRLPGMDGLALARALRTDARFAAMRLLLLSPLKSDLSAAELPPGTALLAKPIRLTALYATLTRQLSEDAAADSALAPAPAARREVDSLALSTGRASILLAEDNKINQQVALGILKRFGLSATVVGTGHEALAALRRQAFDLVLMDVQMPELDGLEAARRIRAGEDDQVPREIPIIAMTAHAMQGDRDRCLAAGMNDYMAKPINPQRLEEVLRAWLPAGAPAPSNAAR